MYKKFTDDTIEKSIFNDIWKFCQAYYIPEQTDEYWNAVIKAQEELVAKYPQHQIVKDFSELFIADLERRQ